MSVAVVSYSFSRPDRVAEATRLRVLAVAEELGYAGPDPAARALRTGKTGTIGFLFQRPPDGSIPAWVSPITHALLQSCASRGVSLIIPTADVRPSLDGVIIFRPYDPANIDESAPHVWIGPGEPQRPGAIFAGPDGFLEAVADVKRHGHERVGFVGDPVTLEACKLEASAYGPKAIVVPVPDESYTSGTGLVETLSSASRPTALFVMGSSLAFGVRKAAESAGLRIPEDLSLVATDNIGSLPHDISAVGLPISKITDAAVGRLLATIDGALSTDDTLAIPTEYRPGGTVAVAPPKQ